MKNKRLFLIVLLLLVASLMLAACGGAADTADDTADDAGDTTTDDTADDAEEDTTEDTSEDTAEEESSDDVVQIRWFVGLGAGSDEPTIEPQRAIVEEFNATHDDIELVIEIVDADSAQDTLATQIAAGNAPDIAGPVGILGRDTFKGAWLDLQPLIDANDYDLSDFDPAMVEFYQVQEEGQLGLPFGIYPSFILYNQDLFDEAGLPYPPAEHGAPYVNADGEEVEWNMDALRELAMQLTVDANGNDATSEDFDPENIVQFGFQNQWTDPRGIGTFFGAGSIVDENGNAQVPESWEAAWKWTYDGWWEDWFIPNGPYGGAEFLQGAGGPFSSGNMGMVHMHLWYVAPWALGDSDFSFGVAATPSYEGTITAKMHADTFGILKASEHPEEAFEVISYLISPEVAIQLLNIYGGMPARLSLQDEWLANYFTENFPGQDINTDVIIDAMGYADNPNHESWMPSFLETQDRYNEFWNKLANEPDLDVDAEIEALLTDLQAIFDAAAE